MKKDKVGILSFPTACNHGAYLQVYALREYLRDQNYNVEVINYRNKKHFFNELRSLFIKKNFRILFLNIVRYVSYRKAHKRFDLKKMTFDHKEISSQDYNVIVIGGDIVWEFQSPFVGHDPIYYGHNLKSQKIISYAASCGNAKVENSPDYVKSGVKFFSAMGVRDSESLKIANIASTKANKKIVLDTTLIYDFPGTKNTYHKRNYLLIYAFTITEKDKAELIAYANKNDLDIFSVTFNKSYSWASKNFVNIDPLHFVSLYEHASFIYTSTFHGLLFAIKYKKQVALRNNPTIQAKCSWLIEKLNLKNVIVSDTRTVSKIYNDRNLFDDEFDNTLSDLKAQSELFLHENIGN